MPDPNRPGRELSKSFRARNWTEARRVHAKRINAVPEGLEPRTDKITVDENAAEVWTILEGMIATGERAATTLENYRNHHRNHIAPFSTGAARECKSRSGPRL